MFARIEDNAVVEWPIPSIHVLFPNTSFPSPLTDADLPQGYVAVRSSDLPVPGTNQKVLPGDPVQQGGAWVQGWDVVDMTAPEITERDAVLAAAGDARRAEAYRLESDPLFFKAQRGEATMADWLAKVAEIKAR